MSLLLGHCIAASTKFLFNLQGLLSYAPRTVVVDFSGALGGAFLLLLLPSKCCTNAAAAHAVRDCDDTNPCHCAARLQSI
jgi:hypothetical protein